MTEMTADTPDLTALLGSRICHDIISPLGAIGNGVELLEMTGAAGPEVALIAESVTNANARIRFFRIAFGQAGPDQRIGRNEILGILADLGRGGRLQIDWQAAGELPRPEVKLAFLALQCLETAMPYGGRITAGRGDAGWRLSGTATKLKTDPAPWALLAEPGAATPGLVHFPLLAEEAARQGRRLTHRIDATEVAIGF